MRTSARVMRSLEAQNSVNQFSSVVAVGKSRKKQYDEMDKES
jgi:hypothetical protein